MTDATHRSAPTLETERLRLRAWRRDDFERWYGVMREPAVHLHFGPEPIGKEECWRRLSAAVGSWQLIGFGSWAVERKRDGVLVGNVGLFNAWRGLDPEFGDEPEIGWIFATETHGQGMAREACEAAIAWAEATLDPVTIWAIIAPANEPSMRLAGKLGFVALHDTDYHGSAVTVLKRDAW